MTWPPKEDVLGTGISTTSIDELVRALAQRHADRAVVVNVCNVHSVMSARTDAELAGAFAAGDVNTPDGMPLVWFLRRRGHEAQSRVKGSELALAAVEHGLARGWRHYFYGATDDTLAQLTSALAARHPDIVIAGTEAPPFRPLDEAETDAALQRIREARPDIVWVGLGMPKQEKWMHRVSSRLPGTVLVGVGAAFDFLAGTKPEAPRWLQDAGLEWAFRLASEPRRLWRRYAWNNPAFLALWARDLARSKRESRS